jgi:hypothetical protein
MNHLHEMSEEERSFVVRHALRLIQSKRTTETGLKLPSSHPVSGETVVFPASDLLVPPMYVYMVELEYPAELRDKVTAHHNAWIKLLPTKLDQEALKAGRLQLPFGDMDFQNPGDGGMQWRFKMLNKDEKIITLTNRPSVT